MLAGCSGMFEGSDESTRTASENDVPAGPEAGTVSDPEAVVSRVDTDRRPVWLADSDGRPTESRHSRRLMSEVIDTASKADQIALTEDVDRSTIDSFLGETDFETESVYLQSAIVEECFRLTLCQISWATDTISTDYGRVSRPYDEPCTAGNEVYSVWFIRIPDTLNADDVSSYSSSIGGSGCDGQRASAEGEGGGGLAPDSDRRTLTGGEQA
ncbi:hypothetical protein C437_07702 [Haloarcula vallismortis ATCC 29715]|nr:hypothetical protein C437_07702 [Haloarcula vallismortis ATCC 29715]